MAKVGKSSRHVEIKDVSLLGPKYDPLFLLEFDRKNGKVICTVDHYQWLGSAPQYAFDAVARGRATTVGEIKRYISEHPAA